MITAESSAEDVAKWLQAANNGQYAELKPTFKEINGAGWAKPIEAAYDDISGKEKLQAHDKAIQDLYHLAQSYILDIKLFTEHITEQSTVEGYLGFAKIWMENSTRPPKKLKFPWWKQCKLRLVKLPL